MESERVKEDEVLGRDNRVDVRDKQGVDVDMVLRLGTWSEGAMVFVAFFRYIRTIV